MRALRGLRDQDGLAKALFRPGVPVATIEFEEDRGVGDGHRGLEDKNAEELGGLVELVDDLLVGKLADACAVEHGVELPAVFDDTWRIVGRDKGELLVSEDAGAKVPVDRWSRCR